MHTDPDILVLLALGEEGVADPDDLDHLAHCPVCESEVTTLRRTVSLGRSLGDPVTLHTPAPQVWDRIRAQTATANGERAVRGLVTPSDDQVTGGSGGAPVVVADTASEAGPATDPSSSVRPMIGRSRVARPDRIRRVLTVAVAAGLALIVGVVATLALQRGLAPTDTLLAATQLSALPDWSGSTGEAELELDADGRRWLVVTVQPSKPVGGFQQVWLINSDVTAMLQVGLLASSRQRFPLPDDVDVSRFPVVDVSDEPATDDGAHSGNSIVRGVLQI
jgi:hypothetical protein